MDRRNFIKSAALGTSILSMSGSLLAGQEKGYQKGDFKLVLNGTASDIYFDSGDHEVVSIASLQLCRDIEAVTGVLPSLKNSSSALGKQSVIIGTIGQSKLVDSLIKDKRIDVSDVRGKWETFLLTTVEKPAAGIDRAFVIAGSDRRGTAFGVFELSSQIGVSPWVWWADSKPEPKNELVIKSGARILGPPSVKYRGIFINDEDFGLQPWAAKTFEPELGDIGPKTYAKVFELLLRLKANHIWPAMHHCTKAFNIYPENKVVADRYAIVMGSSHCEQMLRNNVTEWDNTNGPWMYQANKKGVLNYWEERVRENGKYENIYTLGMRAIHDSPMYAVGSRKTKIKLYERIMADQRGLLEKHVNPDAAKVPQIFCPYNEMLEYYQDGLRLPDDVTMMWVDDNHGYIRQLSDPQEQERSGGSGVYYHISYWGPPHDYLWLCSTPPALIWEQMYKAWSFDAKNVWMLNVGDIKPGEMMTELFLRMAWDIDQYSHKSVNEFLLEFAGSEYGKDIAEEIADIMTKCYQLNFQRKPEHMGFNKIAAKGIPAKDPEFSISNYGDESKKRTDEYRELEQRAAALYDALPEYKRDSFYQQILYTVRCSALQSQMFLFAHKNREYAKQGRASAKEYGQRAHDAWKSIQEETRFYNEDMAGGKWRGMMDSSPKDIAAFKMPKTQKARLAKEAKLGVAVEGIDKPVTGAKGKLPVFNKATRQRYFIDIFNKGTSRLTWKAVPSHDWIMPGKSGGEIESEERVWVDIDYDLIPQEKIVEGSINIEGAGKEVLINIEVENPSVKKGPGTFVQDNGVISILAGSCPKKYDGKSGTKWAMIDGLGRSGKAMVMLPHNADSVSPVEIEARSPVMEFPIHVIHPGKGKVLIEILPTYAVHEGRGLSLAVSLDNNPPELIQFKKQGQTLLGFYWGNDVLEGMLPGGLSMDFKKGPHTLKVWGTEPGVVVDKIVIDFGGLKKSYLGPPETKCI